MKKNHQSGSALDAENNHPPGPLSPLSPVPGSNRQSGSDFASAFATCLPKIRECAVDLCMGEGTLLAAVGARHSIGIDSRLARKPEGAEGDWHCLCADLARLYPLMAEAGWKADLFALKPPWDLQWHTKDLSALGESECTPVKETWARIGHKPMIDSTLATYLIALDRCTWKGEGYLICLESTAHRIFAEHPALLSFAWLWLSIPVRTGSDAGVRAALAVARAGSDKCQSGIGPGSDAVIYFARSHNQGFSIAQKTDLNGPGPFRLAAPQADAGIVRHLLAPIADQRRLLRKGFCCWSRADCEIDTVPLFNAIREEWLAANNPKPRAFNLWLAPDGTIKRQLTAFQECSRKISQETARSTANPALTASPARTDTASPARTPASDPARTLNELRGQTPMALVVQRHTRNLLLTAVHSDLWRVDPALVQSVELAVRQYKGARAPFYQLNEVQRLGYLDEADTIICKKRFALGDGKDGAEFVPGERYPITCSTVQIERREQRANLLGQMEDVTLRGQALAVAIHLPASKQKAEFLPRFGKSPVRLGQLPVRLGLRLEPDKHLGLEELVEYFVIPHVADVAELEPERFTANKAAIARIEQGIVARGAPPFKRYQVEDLARAAMHDGCVLSWDPGLGKTRALFTLPQIKGAKRILIVAPESLHEQIIEEGLAVFGIAVRRLNSQQDYLADADLHCANLQLLNRQPINVTGWWITSYQALGYNGADMWAPKETDAGKILLNSVILKARKSHPGYIESADFGIGQSSPSSRPGQSGQPGPSSPYRSSGPFQGSESSCGSARPPGSNSSCGSHPRCLFRPSLAVLVADLFDCVACDEAVRLKSNESHISLGVRETRPRYRWALTATPIKNRLDDIFWLCHWAAGGNEAACARFPYANTNAAREDFANEHMLLEQNHTKEAILAEQGKPRRVIKRTPMICNIHRLWKLLAPLVMRRRKDDTGEELVPKTIVPMRVIPGKTQNLIYEYHASHKPEYSRAGEPLNPVARVVAQLQNLRQAALCPDSKNLRSISSRQSISSIQSITSVLAALTASPARTTPKHAAILQIVCDQISKGEQVVVMSPFQAFGNSLYRQLAEARVSACLLDGTVPPSVRGVIARQFKQARYAVLIGGQKAMGEGNSFECASCLILPSLDWPYDINAQCIDRVHRLNSPKPVTIYLMVTANTIDVRLESLFHEKSNSSQLALDGRLFADRTEEINLGELLRDAIAEFDPAAPTIDEAAIEKEWPAFKSRLAHAETLFRQFRPISSRTASPARTPIPPLTLPGTALSRKAAAARFIDNL